MGLLRGLKGKERTKYEKKRILGCEAKSHQVVFCIASSSPDGKGSSLLHPQSFGSGHCSLLSPSLVKKLHECSADSTHSSLF